MASAALLAVVLVAALVACEPPPPPPAPVLVGCDRAAEHLVLTVPTVLDPACRYTGGIEITASNVSLDCAGATVGAPDPTTGGVGILVSAPADADLAHIAVRHCAVEGFLNSLRVTRTGFKALAAGTEYDHGYQDVVIEDSTLAGARGTGLYVDGDVTGVTLRRLEISGSGGAGIYLEAGSKGISVLANHIHDNGYAGTGPDGTTFTVGTTLVRYRSRGREGIAVDGSRQDLIAGNDISGNAAGGIFLYKNCGEFVHQKPTDWWSRVYGSDGNVISGNAISAERVGVWVASRQNDNQQFMDCSDPQVVSGPLVAMYEDHAAHTSVVGNTFDHVTWGVRVEDDGTIVRDNRFTGSDPTGAAVAIGTQQRTAVLHHPVSGSTITGNVTDAPNASAPYRWAYGKFNTTFTANVAANGPTTLTTGTMLANDPFLFVVQLL